jgi:RimJ/RimL family protein N-acetyltransferase
VYFKKLTGKKCYLSPMDSNDAEQFTRWLNDMEVLANLDIYGGVISLEHERTFLSNLSKDHNYSIVDLEKNELIGSCGFKALDHLNQSAEIGIFIGNRDYWNRGYGTEALSLLLDYGFRALNLHNVMLRVYEYNLRAKRCYEKTGFKEIGMRREALCRDRKRHGLIYMDLLPEDFYPR